MLFILRGKTGLITDIEKATEIDTYMQDNYPLEWKEALKINHAHYARVKRLKKKIANISVSYCSLRYRKNQIFEIVERLYIKLERKEMIFFCCLN